MSDPYEDEPAPIREDTVASNPATVADCQDDYANGAQARAAFDKGCQ